MGFVFMYGLMGKLLILTGSVLCFLNITQNTCISNGQDKIGCLKINLADQYDHVSIKKLIKSSY